jgi:hypothetical protein
MMKMAAMAILLAGCNLVTTGPGPDDSPVCNAAHAWGDKNGDGIGYRFPTTNIWVDDTSGYPLDLGHLGMGILTYSREEKPGAFRLPMTRVDEPGNGWLGLARVWVNNSTGIVNRADVQMNAGYSEMGDPAYATHVGCMEVLHPAGLGHQNGADSCMNDCAGARDWAACMRNPGAQTPDAHDQEQLAIIYERPPPPPPEVCVGAELTLLTFTFPAQRTWP